MWTPDKAPPYVVLIDTGEGALALVGQAATAKEVLTLANETSQTVTPDSVFIYRFAAELVRCEGQRHD